MNTLDDVLKHLSTEIAELAQLVEKIDDDAWDTATPAPGWTITDQMAHLTFVFNLARTAAAAPEEFKAVTAAAAGNFDGAVNAALKQFNSFPPQQMLARFRSLGEASVQALTAVPAGQVVPWLVNPLPPVVLGCAGIMEVFAHGQDIADALGIHRPPTERLRDIVDFAWLTRDFGYESHGLTPPAEPFRFELTAPSGESWTVGPADATETITGSAHDLCLLVTRRRHRDDLALTASGKQTDRWLDIAQAYRGPAGQGRRPGQFAATGN
ncbi:TIGR03084 family metal-binding protein [Streptomyces sp. SM11]|uniref:TIGR03084 family metal-binding protein n=1 Tax=Streptomyces sp. SM11 TaxID=565557 RepID=UPI000CD4E46F|nr:TIGR03084 family metal-binding protein [Streptomyces sp. SM11]